MATIILTAVGTYLGGPIGGAIGSAIGKQIDYELFKPKGREGPRLGDLSLQTSSYGNRIPRLYGKVRVAGTVIWATDLQESRSSQSNGKRQPKTTVYSYTASFAVALASRRISGVGRIWADGKLLCGAAGDFKTPCQFRFYAGDEDQPVDPLIAATEGAGNAPAYRGMAYAVLEDLQLGDFGNRIPNLSFELFADDGPVSISTLARDLVPHIDAACPTELAGFVLARGSARQALERIGEVVPLRVSESPTLKLFETPAAGTALPQQALGAVLGESGADRIVRAQIPAQLVASSVRLAYADPERDYQAGEQTARWIEGADAALVLDLPATLDAAQAAKLAQRALEDRWTARRRAKVSLPIRFAHLGLGQLVTLAGEPSGYRIVSTSLEAMTIRLELVEHRPPSGLGTAADGGRHLGNEDVLTGQSRISLIDLPAARLEVATQPQIALAASGSAAGWRSASLLQSGDGGASWAEIGSTALPAIMGEALSVLPPGQAWVIDRAHSVEIQLAVWMEPPPASDTQALLSARHPALLGDEVILFGRVEPLGGARYRLTDLVRGYRGTEWAMGAHSVGERFIMLDEANLLPLSVAIGTPEASVLASGLGDVLPVEAVLPSPGAALRPLPPVHLTARTLANGDLDFNWIRRSRGGWMWQDLLDAPLSEEAERYQLLFMPNQGASRSYDLTAAQWTYPAADRLSDLGSGSSFAAIQIIQIGTYGASRSTTWTIDL